MMVSFHLKTFLAILATTSAAVSIEVSNSTDIIGTQLSVMINDTRLVVWSFVTDASSANSIENNSVFLNAQIPSACGDRLFRCNAELFKDTRSSRAVLAISLPYGVALSLYNEINSANFTFVDQYVAVPQEHKINCSFTSFTTTTDDRLIVSCLKFTPEILYEVSMWLFELHVNFIAINESYLRLLNRDGPYLSYSTGISPLFFYDQDNDHEPFIIWFDDGVLFVAFLDSPHFEPEETEVDTAGGVCSGNKVTDVRQSLDRRQLLVYCSQNIAVEVDVMRRGIGVLKTRSKTRFYCKSQWEEPYLEERNNTLVLVSHEQKDSIIPHPLNLSEGYVGDCVMIENTVWFIGSSRDGTIILKNVLENQTTVLTTNATVDHQLIDGQVLLFSDSNSSTVVDLACPSFRFTVSQTFVLSTFVLNRNVSCPGGQVPSDKTAPSFLAIVISLTVVGLLVLVLSCIIFCLRIIYCCYKRLKRSLATHSPVPDTNNLRERNYLVNEQMSGNTLNDEQIVENVLQKEKDTKIAAIANNYGPNFCSD